MEESSGDLPDYTSPTTQSPKPTQDTPPQANPAQQASVATAPVAPSPQIPPVPTPNSQYAGFWIRVVAAIIDGIAIGIISFIVGIILGIATGNAQSSASDWIGIFIQIAYFVSMEASVRQATFGKSILGLKVQDMDGNRISYGKAFIRTIGKFVSGIILGIGYIMVGFTSKKQGLHDMIAGTVVVKK